MATDTTKLVNEPFSLDGDLTERQKQVAAQAAPFLALVDALVAQGHRPPGVINGLMSTVLTVHLDLDKGVIPGMRKPNVPWHFQRMLVAALRQTAQELEERLDAEYGRPS